MKKIIIIEDDAIISEGIQDMIKQLGYQTVGVFYTKKEFEANSNFDFDLALIDIMLSKQPDGFEIAKSVREKYQKPFIFATSYSDKETLKEAKFYKPSGYIVKPFNKEDLFAAIEIIPEEHDIIENPTHIEKPLQENTLFYKDQHVLKKIVMDDIIYIKSDRNYLEVYDKNNRHIIRSTLHAFSEKLPSCFIQVHRSYLVNIKHIETIKSTYLIAKIIKIPISSAYRDTLVQLIEIL